ncbi:MAG: hypothetical protein IAF58_09980 [Leptolyngbya sp.]|nr:hypothetical protein [Candidatus Melainabacteria bacterium]
MTKRLQIQAASNALPPEIVTELNEGLESLSRVVDIEFADTEFFKVTSFAKVELTIEISFSSSQITYIENTSENMIQVYSVILVSQFDKDRLSYGYQYVKEAAVLALLRLAEKYNLDARMLSIRAFHIRGDVQRSKIYAALPPLEDSNSSEVQIHIRITNERYGEREEIDFLLFPFIEKIESILEIDEIGEVEGNEIGEGYFTLYCVGDNPHLMLERISPYLVESSRSKEDFVILKKDTNEEKIFIAALKSKR